MNTQHEFCFKRFQLQAMTAAEAQNFLRSFYKKLGHLAGCGYFCSEQATYGPPGGPYSARIGMIPWPFQIDPADCLDFDKLIADFNAAELSVGLEPVRLSEIIGIAETPEYPHPTLISANPG